MTFTLTFSSIQDGQRKPLLKDGLEATLSVEANNRSEAIYHADTVDFCNLHNCTVRRIS